MDWIKYCFAVVCVIAVAVPVAHAHHLWLIRGDDGYVVARGTLERIDPYDPGCIKEIRAYADDGRVVPVQRIDERHRVYFMPDKPVAMVTVTSEWGYRVNTTKGKKFMTRGEAQDAGLHVLDAFFSTHCAKSLFCSVTPVDKPVGMKFEIVPLEDPYRTTPGTDLPVKLLFDGKPLAGVSIFTDNGEEVETDENGIARLRKSANVRQLIYSRHRIAAVDRGDLDYLVFTAFLTIETAR